jgi:predicted GNAT family acetyltransferase
MRRRRASTLPLLPAVLLLLAAASTTTTTVRAFLHPSPSASSGPRLLQQHQQQQQQQQQRQPSPRLQAVTPSRWGQQPGRLWASVDATNAAAAAAANAAAAASAASAASAEADPSLLRGHGYYGAPEGRRRVLGEDGMVLVEGPAPGTEEGEGQRVVRLLLLEGEGEGEVEVGRATFVEARGGGLCLTGVEVPRGQRGKGYGRRVVLGALERFLNKGGRIAQVSAAVPTEMGAEQQEAAKGALLCAAWKWFGVRVVLGAWGLGWDDCVCVCVCVCVRALGGGVELGLWVGLGSGCGVDVSHTHTRVPCVCVDTPKTMTPNTHNTHNAHTYTCEQASLNGRWGWFLLLTLHLTQGVW